MGCTRATIDEPFNPICDSMQNGRCEFKGFDLMLVHCPFEAAFLEQMRTLSLL